MRYGIPRRRIYAGGGPFDPLPVPDWNKTPEAVDTFQQWAGLKNDGIFGKNTTKAWNQKGRRYMNNYLEGPQPIVGDRVTGSVTGTINPNPINFGPRFEYDPKLTGIQLREGLKLARKVGSQPYNPATTGTTSTTGSKFMNYINSDKFRDATENLAPFASNIANAFRKPPIPSTPIPDQYTALHKINMDDARNQVATTYQAADRSADRNVDSNTAEAIKAFNRGERMSKFSTINEQEAITNAGISNQQAGMDAAVTASNIAKQNKFRDELIERQIADQREQSANLANAGDKMAMLTTEKRKARTEIAKAQVMSTAFKNSGVYERHRMYLRASGQKDPTGNDFKDLPPMAYGGMIPKRKITY